MKSNNILPQLLEKEVYSILTGDFFPWYYSPVTNVKSYELYGEEGGLTGAVENPQFYHIFYNEKERRSSYCDLIYAMVNVMSSAANINVESIVRVKANLLYRNPDLNQDLSNPIHHDYHDISGKNHEQFLSIVYFVDDSDGDLIVFDKSWPDMPVGSEEVYRFSPERNSAVFLPSNMYHAGTNPIKNDRRIVISFILKVQNS
jgi:hypothetical protein